MILEYPIEFQRLFNKINKVNLHQRKIPSKEISWFFFFFFFRSTLLKRKRAIFFGRRFLKEGERYCQIENWSSVRDRSIYVHITTISTERVSISIEVLSQMFRRVVGNTMTLQKLDRKDMRQSQRLVLLKGQRNTYRSQQCPKVKGTGDEGVWERSFIQWTVVCWRD